MGENGKLTFTETVEASPAAVYYALTNGAALREWLCTNSQVDTREGGRIYLWWQQGYYASGEFTALEPEKSVAFSWQGRGEARPTDVSISLEANGKSTKVHLVHAGLGDSEKWTQTRQELKQGWQSGLANLKSVLETGLDKRIYDQPFMGIFIGGQVSAEEAKELDIPAEGGIRVSGTMEGTGAAAAGLQNGDILTEMGGSATKDFASLRAAVSPHRIGDKLKITIYRDGEKQNTLMELGRRPLPNVPAAPAAFAEQLKETYDRLDAELDEVLKGVTEDEASYRSADDAWNVKEILAHLITSERMLQAGVATRITDGVLDGFPNNPSAWMKSVTAVYQTLPQVVALWKQTEAETVALVANLPPEFVSRKATYANAGTTLLTGFPGHSQSHFTQIRDLVAAAREAKEMA
jgi:uncharacterized protein YndB with AHSA1/START domain